MADVDFIIEILAKLRDEAGPGLAKLKGEIDALKGTQDAQRGTDDLAESIGDLGKEADKTKAKHEDLRKEHEKSSRASEAAGRGTRDLSRDVDQSARSHDKAAESVGSHAKTQEEFSKALKDVKEGAGDSEKAIDRLNKKYDELQSRHADLLDSTPKTAEEFEAQRVGLEKVGRELDSVGDRYAALAKRKGEAQAEEARIEGLRAKEQADRLYRTVSDSRPPIRASTDLDALKQKAEQTDKVLSDYNKNRDSESSDQARALRGIAAEYSGIAGEARKLEGVQSNLFRKSGRARDELRNEARDLLKTQTVPAADTLNQRVSQVNNVLKDYNDSSRNSVETDNEKARSLRAIAGEYENLSKEARKYGEYNTFQKTGGLSEDLRKQASAILNPPKVISNDVEDLDTRVSKLDTSWKDFDRTLSSGSLSKGEAALKVKQYANEMRNLSKETDFGSENLRTLSSDLERANKLLKDPNFGSTGGIVKAFNRGFGGENKGFGEGIESLSHKFDDLGVRITGVSSFLRGFFDLAKIGLSQQLISGITSLAGGLLSVASAAAQAGAALGGVFISGLGQAIPMIAIVAASMERFKNILQAVSVAGQAEQQHFYDPTEKQVTQLQNISQLISAQQQLSNSAIQLFEAQQRVKDSQIQLTEARYTAQRQITELAEAEKSARLQAEGANLSLIESRRQLTIATEKGNVAGIQQAELAVREAELSKQKAQYDIPKAEREARLARQRGVSGAPSVIGAVEGLEGAKVAVLQAQQAGEAAKRQEQITKLQQAARSSKETTYEAQLKFLKKGMSPTELGLTDSLIGIEKELKSPDSPLKKITDYFVEPFANAIERIRSLLKNASFLGPIDELAKAMGAGLGKLEKTTYGGEGTSFFETMAKDASSNIPVVTSAIQGIMKLFEDIAKAADPAFHKLSEDWNNFWHNLDRKYEGNGLEKLTDFFNKSAVYAERFAHLGAALFELFKAVGHDAAPQGLATVNSFSEAIKKATEWVQSHGPEVTRFFREAREGLSLIGQMLFGIGASIIKVFSLSSLTAFNGFVQQVLLPGLRNVVTVFGFITTKILDVFNIFGRAGSIALEAIGSILAFGYTFVKIIGFVKELIKTIAEIKIVLAEIDWEALLLSPWTAIAGLIAGAAYALSGFSTEQKKVKISTEEVNDALEKQAEALRAIKSLNDEYKSSELSVKEAKTQVTSAKQNLVKARKEPLLKGESSAERKVRVESDEQQLQRAIITRSEREREFSQLPSKQVESSSKSVRESGQAVSTLRSSYSDKLENLNELKSRNREIEKFESGLSKEEKEEIRTAGLKLQIPLEKELSEAKEKLTNATKNNSEAVKQSNELIAKSSTEAASSAPKINKAYEEAYRKFEESVSRGAGAAKSGMETIRQLVDNALKKYGVSPAEISGKTIRAPRETQSGQMHASGAYIPPTSGGHRAVVSEAGYGEAILSTDPRHATRSRAILGQYLQNAPHMASGGPVGYESPFHGAINWGRSDQGTDVNLSPGSPITAIGEAQVKGVIPNWYKGQPYIWYELLSGMDKGKDVYVAEQINRLAKVGSILKAGQPVGYYAPSGTGIETGWSTAAGQTLAMSTSGYKEGEATPAGKAFTTFLRGLAAGKVAAGGLGEILAPHITGGGSIGKVAQGALNLAAKAANIFVGKHGSGGSSAGIVGAGWSGTWVHVMEQIAKAKHWSLSAWRNVVNRESGGRPGVMNSIGAFGLGQFLPMNYGKYGPGSRPGSTADQQIESMAEYIASRYQNPSNALAHEEQYNWYATGGIVGDSVRRLAVRHLRKKILKFAQGGRAPWGGAPVPVIAHEGERIMNPSQYSETARLAGTSASGLDHHLGYDSSPRQSFADGGIPSIVGYHRQSSTGSTSLPSSLGLPAAGSLNIGGRELGSINALIKLIKAISEGFEKISKSKSPEKYKEEINGFFKSISEAFEYMNEGREALKARLSKQAVGKEYTETGKFVSSGKGFKSSGNQGTVSLGTGGEVKIAEESFKSLREENIYLEKEQQSLNNDKKRISEDIKRSKSKTAIAMFKQEYNALTKRQKELGELVVSNIEARYQAEVQVLQDKITEANNSYQTISQEQQTAISGAQSLGNLGGIGGLEQQMRQAAENQLNTLTPLLAEAESIGNKELAASLKQEMTSLRQTITNAVVETITNAQTLIQRESGLSESKTSLLQTLSKVASQKGNFIEAGGLEKQSLENKGTSLSVAKQQEEVLREQALREGDTAAVITLTEEINKNTGEIEENNLALKENSVITRELVLNQIQATGSFKTGIYGAAQQGLEIIGKTTGYTNVGGLLSAAKGREGALGTERSELEKQAGGIGLGVEGMTPAQILSYLASPEGQSKLASLEKNEDKAEKEQMYKLVDALESNSTNTLKNAEEIAKLNGQLNQPQSWSTTAWSQFRGAFFGGMGNLLPQYSASLPPGSVPTEMPKYGEMSPGASHSGPTIGVLNMTHPVEKLDPALFGEQLSHHIATTPSM